MLDFLKKGKKQAEKKPVKKLSEQQINDINTVMEKTGWDFETTKAAMKKAKKEYGITFRKYTELELYKYEGKDLGSVIATLESKPEKRSRYVELVMVKTGWDYDFARYQMLETKRKYGYTFKQYYKNDLFEAPLEEQDKKFNQMVTDRKAAIAENRENYLSKVIERTGWERDLAIGKITEARERTGCTYEEYFLYRFYEISKEEQANVFLSRESKKITKKYNVNRDFVNILYDKELSNVYFDKYLGRAWCVNTKITEDEFAEKFANSKRVFYKPLKGHHGDGAKSFTITPENIRDVYKELAGYSIGVVEEYIVQHKDLNALAPSAVDTMRVVTLSSNEKPILEGGDNIQIVYASLKMGGVNSVVDNLVGGGMVAAVDLEKGELKTNAADDQGNVYSEHPGTGTTIKGFKIPYFNEAIDLVKQVYADKKMEGYLGWDIAITENGPVIIEINTVPGVILFQLPYMTELKGMKPYMQQFYED